jgi:hypothetical protein
MILNRFNPTLEYVHSSDPTLHIYANAGNLVFLCFACTQKIDCLGGSTNMHKVYETNYKELTDPYLKI